MIETAKISQKIGKVFAGKMESRAIEENLFDTSYESAEQIDLLKYTPGGAFGSARYKLKGIKENRREYERLIEVFKAHDIGYFFYNGGGDQWILLTSIANWIENEFPITSIGIPKTVDNDLPITDTCPGFGSVAKYIAVSTNGPSLDVLSMAETSTKVFY